MTTLLALLLAPVLASDLTVDGTTVTLDGTQSYDNIYVINGGSIVVSDYDGTGTTGTLILEADYIEVDSTSSIVADGAGYIGQTDGDGEGPGGGAGGSSYDDGGGGGAHGGDGGDGVMDDCTTPDGPGGTSYGDVTATNIDMGSAGGAAGAADGDSGGEGASGGGAITLSAAWIVMEGTISANGDAGTEVNDDATGGGAGGGVLIVADELDCDGTIEAMGGDGGSADDAGGGGGGGVVKQFYDSSINSCSVDTDGGEAGRTPGRVTFVIGPAVAGLKTTRPWLGIGARKFTADQVSEGYFPAAGMVAFQARWTWRSGPWLSADALQISAENELQIEDLTYGIPVALSGSSIGVTGGIATPARRAQAGLGVRLATTYIRRSFPGQDVPDQDLFTVAPGVVGWLGVHAEPYTIDLELRSHYLPYRLDGADLGLGFTEAVFSVGYRF